MHRRALHTNATRTCPEIRRYARAYLSGDNISFIRWPPFAETFKEASDSSAALFLFFIYFLHLSPSPHHLPLPPSLFLSRVRVFSFHFTSPAKTRSLTVKGEGRRPRAFLSSSKLSRHIANEDSPERLFGFSKKLDRSRSEVDTRIQKVFRRCQRASTFLCPNAFQFVFPLLNSRNDK